MDKITTIEKTPQVDHLIIRYVFTLAVPPSLVAKEGSATRKITGETHWQNGTDIEIIKKDLERRYTERQGELNKEAISSPSDYTMSYDGVKWL